MKPFTIAAMFAALNLVNAGPAPTERTNEEPRNSRTAGITFLVYDFAKLRESELASWQKEVTHIMAAAGTRAEWVSCGRGNEFTDRERCGQAQPGDVFLRLLDGRNVQGPGVALGYLGLAEPDWGGRGLITMMVNNVRELAAGTLWQFPDLLAHATAHEIGHIFGIQEHSRAGVMRSDWRKGIIKQMNHAALVFSDEEAQHMREAARLRISKSQGGDSRLS